MMAPFSNKSPMVATNVWQNPIGTLYRFRGKMVAFTADVNVMCLYVGVHQEVAIFCVFSGRTQWVKKNRVYEYTDTRHVFEAR